jgi:hypothetical protein
MRHRHLLGRRIDACLKSFFENRGIEKYTSNFHIDAIKTIREDMELFWEEER